MSKYYKEVKAKADFVELEKEVLKFWEEDKTFEKSVTQRSGAEEFVFYDGPPFANGTPHYGHIMVSYVKDVVARFQTMLGKKVERRLGWDCHGLPAEMSAEKQLGVSGRKQISLHDLRGQTVYICEYGLLEDFDAAFDVLKAHCPQSTLVPFNFLDFEVFTQAEKDKAVIINVQHWAEAHPLFKSCAIDWPLTARFGLIFAKHPSASLQLFLDCLPRPQPQA